MLECCVKCNTPLYETVGSNRKIFRSFATKNVNGVDIHLCIRCYEGMNKGEENHGEKEEN